jgi:hypothetical protein
MVAMALLTSASYIGIAHLLGMPIPNGWTIPLEAAPTVFGWLAKFEPMHQVFLGARALLYLDGRADAGLTHALVMTGVGMVIALLIGGIVTRLYDRRGLRRIRDPEAAFTEPANSSKDT